MCMLWVLRDKLGQKPKLPSALPVGLRLLLIFGQLFLILYQFIMVLSWLTLPLREWPVPADVHLLCYFFLVGLVCSIIMLPRLAAPRPQQQIS
jgi:hypothetical protein